jgi:hypothetical protein
LQPENCNESRAKQTFPPKIVSKTIFKTDQHAHNQSRAPHLAVQARCAWPQRGRGDFYCLLLNESGASYRFGKKARATSETPNDTMTPCITNCALYLQPATAKDSAAPQK